MMIFICIDKSFLYTIIMDTRNINQWHILEEKRFKQLKCLLKGFLSQLNNLLFAGDGKCVICDSYVRPCTLVRICDECNYGSYQGRCVICGGPGVSDAYYCKECTIMEKDVRIMNIYKL